MPSAAGAVAHTAAPAQDHPAGTPCEKCGDEILSGQANQGYTRCDDCDPEGDHQRGGDGNCGRCATHCHACDQPLPDLIGARHE